MRFACVFLHTKLIKATGELQPCQKLLVVEDVIASTQLNSLSTCRAEFLFKIENRLLSSAEMDYCYVTSRTVSRQRQTFSRLQIILRMLKIACLKGKNPCSANPRARCSSCSFSSPASIQSFMVHYPQCCTRTPGSASNGHIQLNFHLGNQAPYVTLFSSGIMAAIVLLAGCRVLP